jgi:hypothetical protein
MAANNLTFEQSAAFLTDLYEQATGLKAMAVTDTASFTTVAQTVLKTGYDNVINAISQVLSRTIFSVRPYTAKFKGIMVDNERFGGWVRKINYIDKPVVNEESYPLTDGQSYDPWVIRKPEVVQTNFYGGQRYEDFITMFTWQLDVAFSGPDEFSRWAAGVFQNINDKLEQFREAEARSTLINFIAGKNAGDTGNVINVLQQYYNETGTTLTPANMYADGNYVPFAKWLYSYVDRLTQLLSERSAKYHINLTGKTIMRHTPADRLKGYMSARTLTAINSIALPSLFGADRLRMIDWESVNYWQSIDSPESINATPTYLQADGTLATGTAQVIDNVMGVLFDEEALGLTIINEIMAASPLNPRTLSTNYYWHMVSRTYNDFTENGIVLVADTVTP